MGEVNHFFCGISYFPMGNWANGSIFSFQREFTQQDDGVVVQEGDAFAFAFVHAPEHTAGELVLGEQVADGSGGAVAFLGGLFDGVPLGEVVGHGVCSLAARSCSSVGRWSPICAWMRATSALIGAGDPLVRPPVRPLGTLNAVVRTAFVVKGRDGSIELPMGSGMG